MKATSSTDYISPVRRGFTRMPISLSAAEPTSHVPPPHWSAIVGTPTRLASATDRKCPHIRNFLVLPNQAEDARFSRSEVAESYRHCQTSHEVESIL